MASIDCDNIGTVVEKSICGQVAIFTIKTEETEVNLQFELLCSICTQNFKQFDDFISHIKINHLTLNKLYFNNIEYWKEAEKIIETEFEEIVPPHLQVFIDGEIGRKNVEEDSVLLPDEVLENLTNDVNESILPQILDDTLSESTSTFTEEQINAIELNLVAEDSNKSIKHPSGSSEIPLTVKETTGKLNRKKSKESKLFCAFCDRPFNNSFKLKCHVMIHTGEMPFECEICKKRFRMKATLDAHTTTHLPPEERKFQCETCGLKITTKQSYNSHMRRHVKDYRLECDICKKPVYTSVELKIHMKKHSDEKPYVCEICGVSYKWKEAMDRHMSRHSGQRNFKCDQCEMAFFCPRSRREHIKAVHAKLKNNRCEVCGAAFARRYTLYQHRKLHSDVKEYTCQVCNKAFAQAATLRAHMKTHKS